MAEPPNALTWVVFPQHEPSLIYDALVARGCVTPTALADRELALRVIGDAIADFNAKADDDGPTLWSVLLRAMFEAGLLNEHARRRQTAVWTSRTPLARVRYLLQDLWWRLRY